MKNFQPRETADLKKCIAAVVYTKSYSHVFRHIYECQKIHAWPMTQKLFQALKYQNRLYPDKRKVEKIEKGGVKQSANFETVDAGL